MLRRKVRWIAPPLLALCALAAFLLLRNQMSDREAIIQLIQRLEKAIEEKDQSGILKCISRAYRDDFGVTRRDIARIAFRYVRGTERVELVISDVTLRLQRDTAAASMHVEATYAEAGAAPERYAADIKLFFAREGRSWVVAKSSGWQDRLGEVY